MVSTSSKYPKHFAINEQETYRRGNIKASFDASDSIIEERAAREIYLKPFEMIVRGSKVSTFMSSFNKINGVFAAGNDIIMPGGPPIIKQVLDGYKEGRCDIEDLRIAVSNLLVFVMNSKSFEDYNNKIALKI